IMLGMDAARRSYWHCYGGEPGLGFLLGAFTAKMRTLGIADGAWHKIFVSTPAASFAFARNAGTSDSTS
ncbi:MAG TPA: hypothetical protein VLT83_14100, partial [Opitutaceae bacterium]|nr:hypothetical protein [Opitutaceae bacterium]